MHQARRRDHPKDPDEEKSTAQDVRDAQDRDDGGLHPEDHAADHEDLADEEVHVVAVPVVGERIGVRVAGHRHEEGM